MRHLWFSSPLAIHSSFPCLCVRLCVALLVAVDVAVWIEDVALLVVVGVAVCNVDVASVRCCERVWPQVVSRERCCKPRDSAVDLRAFAVGPRALLSSEHSCSSRRSSGVLRVAVDVVCVAVGVRVRK